MHIEKLLSAMTALRNRYAALHDSLVGSIYVLSLENPKPEDVLNAKVNLQNLANEVKALNAETLGHYMELHNIQQRLQDLRFGMQDVTGI